MGLPSSVGVPGGLVLFTRRHWSSSFSKESLLLFADSLSKLFLNVSRSTESCLKLSKKKSNKNSVKVSSQANTFQQQNVELVGFLSSLCEINKSTWFYWWFFKVPISSKFLFSYLILYLTQWTSAKEKFDLDKMQSFLEVLKTFKFAAILVHNSHQSSLLFEWVVM